MTPLETRIAAIKAECEEILRLDGLATAGPWTMSRGGGHALPSIRGSESIHVNGRQRNSLGISSASYSDEVCQMFADPELEGPKANASFIARARMVSPAACRYVLAQILRYQNQLQFITYRENAERELKAIADAWEGK